MGRSASPMRADVICRVFGRPAAETSRRKTSAAKKTADTPSTIGRTPSASPSMQIMKARQQTASLTGGEAPRAERSGTASASTSLAA